MVINQSILHGPSQHNNVFICCKMVMTTIYKRLVIELSNIIAARQNSLAEGQGSVDISAVLVRLRDDLYVMP